MRWVAAMMLLVVGVCNGAVTELKRDDAAKVWNILRRTDAMSLVMVHDTTSAKSVAHRKLFEEASSNLELYADCYAIDLSDRQVSWITNALNVRISSQFLLFGTTLIQTKSPLARPGGVKYPQTFEGILSPSALKSWLQQKIPEPKTLGVATITADTTTEVEEYVEKRGDEKLLVIVTDKDKVSPVLKSLIVAVNGDAKAVIVKMPSAKAAKLKKLPAITRYVGGERLVMTSDTINRKTVVEFMETVGVLEKLEADESQEMKTIVKKYLKPVTEITSHQEWVDEILDDNKGVVLMAFLDESDSSHDATLKTLAEVAKQRTSLKSVNWASTTKTYSLLNHFGLEPGSVIFISKKHGKWSRFTGAFTTKAITRFVEKSVAKGLGTKDIKTLPEFGN